MSPKLNKNGKTELKPLATSTDSLKGALYHLHSTLCALCLRNSMKQINFIKHV